MRWAEEGGGLRGNVAACGGARRGRGERGCSGCGGEKEARGEGGGADEDRGRGGHASAWSARSFSRLARRVRVGASIPFVLGASSRRDPALAGRHPPARRPCARSGLAAPPRPRRLQSRKCPSPPTPPHAPPSPCPRPHPPPSPRAPSSPPQPLQPHSPLPLRAPPHAATFPRSPPPSSAHRMGRRMHPHGVAHRPIQLNFVKR